MLICLFNLFVSLLFFFQVFVLNAMVIFKLNDELIFVLVGTFQNNSNNKDFKIKNRFKRRKLFNF